jgi:hypothetical protein
MGKAWPEWHRGSSILSPDFASRAAKSAARRNPMEACGAFEYSAVIGAPNNTKQHQTTPNPTDHQPEGRAK